MAERAVLKLLTGIVNLTATIALTTIAGITISNNKIASNNKQIILLVLNLINSD
jgi:hypothetical protein